MTYINRRAWGAQAARSGPGLLDPDDVVGIALHWPAMGRPLRDPRAVRASLRAWQRFHMDTNGWSDIAYQEAIDQAGNVYRLRGLRKMSAANGSLTVNRRYGALLLILAPGEEPTAAMIAAVRRRIRRHRRLFPNSRRIVGHADIRPTPTACPGPIVRAAIAAGAFTPKEKRA